MAYLTIEALRDFGFRKIGKNVKVSEKASVYDPELIEIGDHSRIDDFCVVSGKISIGRNVHITPLCLVAGGEKGIVISDFSTLAYGVQVFTQSDDYSGQTLTNSTIPKKYKNEEKSPIFIGHQVIIGAGSIILPGVTIAEGCSVGAQSLVTHSTEPWGVYVGSPARRVKERKKDLLELEAQYLKEEPRDPV